MILLAVLAVTLVVDIVLVGFDVDFSLTSFLREKFVGLIQQVIDFFNNK